MNKLLKLFLVWFVPPMLVKPMIDLGECLPVLVSQANCGNGNADGGTAVFCSFTDCLIQGRYRSAFDFGWMVLIVLLPLWWVGFGLFIRPIFLALRNKTFSRVKK